jgi:L-ascorbate metabolism protein UlaG (beta-lactamase superfamily)
MIRLTHVGGPTVLVELDEWRLLTDPTFDEPGRKYSFGWGTFSTKTTGPALTTEQVGPVDAILLSHGHHADNLDDAGRALLSNVPIVVTTPSGQRRLRTNDHIHKTRGLRTGRSTTLTAEGKPPLTVTATPCRHGPPLSRPVAGAVTGFLITPAMAATAALWITGDTVLDRRLRRFARNVDVHVLLMHLGAVQFPLTGSLRYSMDSADALELIELSRPRVAVPVHYEGWSHFSEPQHRLHLALATGPTHHRTTLHWLQPGTPWAVEDS